MHSSGHLPCVGISPHNRRALCPNRQNLREGDIKYIRRHPALTSSGAPHSFTAVFCTMMTFDVRCSVMSAPLMSAAV